MLQTARLHLEPLGIVHAEEMFEVLGESKLYRYIDDTPPDSIAALRKRYSRLQTGQSPDGQQLWLNWVIRLTDRSLIGFVQATIESLETTWVAFLLSISHQGQGYAEEATSAMIKHLSLEYGVHRFLATVEVENQPSIRLLERLGFNLASDAMEERKSLKASERLYVRSMLLNP